MKPLLKDPPASGGSHSDTSVEDRSSLPLPEVIENDHATGWGMWDKAVSFQESQSLDSYADTQPSQLAPLFAPVTPSQVAGLTRSAPDNSAEKKRQDAMRTLERDHKRIHAAIDMMWGRKECSAYIQNLVMSGGDGMGNSREGFKMEVVAALLILGDLNDIEWQKPI